MKSLYKIVTVVGLSFMATSCFDKSKPNYQFFPNMYESVAYETYAESDAFDSKDGLKGRSEFLGEMGLNSKNMCKTLVDGIETTFENWKPKDKFNVYKIR